MHHIATFQPTPSTQVAQRIHKLPLDGLYFIEPHRSDDFRGFYSELQLLPDLNAVLPAPFAVQQVNHARSEHNVARGFHAEDWNKIITVTRGTCACVWVDLRKDSTTFGQPFSLLMGDGQSALYGSVFVAKGIGNGYVVTEGPADYVYVTDALYRDRDPQFDQAISLFDNELNIQWPVPRMNMVLSQRDKQAISLAELRQKYEHSD